MNNTASHDNIIMAVEQKLCSFFLFHSTATANAAVAHCSTLLFFPLSQLPSQYTNYAAVGELRASNRVVGRWKHSLLGL